MRKAYTVPEMEIEYFEKVDIICASAGDDVSITDDDADTGEGDADF